MYTLLSVHICSNREVKQRQLQKLGHILNERLLKVVQERSKIYFLFRIFVTE